MPTLSNSELPALLADLQLLVDFMRRNGVAALKAGGVELALTSAVAQEAEPVPDSKPEVKPEPVLGKDGLTAEQQVEFYGRVLDAQEP